MKYLKLNICRFAAALVILNACSSDELFEREQYKAVVAVKSSGSFNVYEQVIDLENLDANGYTEGFIAANVGGSLITEEPIVLTIKEDAGLLDEYNRFNYETDSYRYAQYLSKSRYSIADLKITIPAGERGGRMPIQLNLEGLSPDTAYILPFRVESSSAYELNLDKSTVLYLVQRKNKWSTTVSDVKYQHIGKKIETANVPSYDALQDPLTQRPPISARTNNSKTVYAVSRDEIRFFAGDVFSIGNNRPEYIIDDWSIKVKIGQDDKLTISSWKNIDVTQVDNDNFDLTDRYLNTYTLEDDIFGNIYKTFRLCYDYVDPNDGKKYRIWEELQIEHIESVK
ncbi:MAG: DUF4361 domain-containing protein [Tannerella sp.]|jgi:hypothetical protein|nr:DUF4361 domain-containing protein [Tannerella sp.]